MESLREQVEYGSWCQHGTPLGTPGGADLMCGYCEDGLTEWVDDPYMTLVVGLNGSPYKPGPNFWMSDLKDPSVGTLRQLAQLRRGLVFWSDLIARSAGRVSATLYMVEGRSGYWRHPT